MSTQPDPTDGSTAVTLNVPKKPWASGNEMPGVFPLGNDKKYRKI